MDRGQRVQGDPHTRSCQTAKVSYSKPIYGNQKCPENNSWWLLSSKLKEKKEEEKKKKSVCLDAF